MAKGGKRIGAGAKPKAITTARDAALKNMEATAERILAWVANLAEDASKPDDIRLDASKEVMNRVWGKHRQAVEVSGKDGGALQINVVSFAGVKA